MHASQKTRTAKCALMCRLLDSRFLGFSKNVTTVPSIVNDALFVICEWTYIFYRVICYSLYCETSKNDFVVSRRPLAAFSIIPRNCCRLFFGGGGQSYYCHSRVYSSFSLSCPANRRVTLMCRRRPHHSVSPQPGPYPPLRTSGQQP